MIHRGFIELGLFEEELKYITATYSITTTSMRHIIDQQTKQSSCYPPLSLLLSHMECPEANALARALSVNDQTSLISTSNISDENVHHVSLRDAPGGKGVREGASLMDITLSTDIERIPIYV